MLIERRSIMHKLFRPTLLVMSSCGALALSSFAGVASAATVPTVVSKPVGAAVQSVGGAITDVGYGHAGIAPTVIAAAPSLEPVADGVTNSLVSLGGGVTYAGQLTQSNGLSLNPTGGLKTAVSSVKNGSLVQARVGNAQLGKGTATTIVGVGALTTSAPQATLASAGVANANGVLTGTLAPQ